MHNSEDMKITFTKMQGAGNDFVVIDATPKPLSLTAAQWARIADRRFGVGADQILLVQASSNPSADFVYRIFNADGSEVEQCGNGARCFARFVHDRGLTDKTVIRVQTKSGIITPQINTDGTVTVDMGAPKPTPQDVGFDCSGLSERKTGKTREWLMQSQTGEDFWISVVSMGNPHAVTWVSDLESCDVGTLGAWLCEHPRFANRVNAGFVHKTGDQKVSLRVYERGAGETLACGTGACAAVVSGILLGVLPSDQTISVQTRGGVLGIAWKGGEGDHVMMTGPAEPVFEGVIEL